MKTWILALTLLPTLSTFAQVKERQAEIRASISGKEQEFLHPKPTVPKLLGPNFYTQADVCADAKKSKPEAKIAIVLIKTHLCDVGTTVCMDSLSTFSDPANVFLQDNFPLYHTRFFSYDVEQASVLAQGAKTKVNQRFYEKEKEIRAEWDKPGSNPELLALDLETCKPLGRTLVKTFHTDFEHRYLAMKAEILSIPGVGIKVRSETTASDRSRIILARMSYPEVSLTDAHNLLKQQSVASGVPAGIGLSGYLDLSIEQVEQKYFVNPRKTNIAGK